MLNRGFEAIGEVLLKGAIIGGDLYCSNGKFKHGGKYALFAQSAEIRGNIFLSNEFQAEGKVSLYGAIIGVTLDCRKGKFNNPGEIALYLEVARIKGSVFLSNGFEATGKVWLSGATIGGNLNCWEGKFRNEGGDALNATGAEIKGSVLLRNSFEAIGDVSLLGATIGGNLECDSGKFTNQQGYALNATGAEIRGSVFLRYNFKASGGVSLYRASIGGNLDCSNGKFENKQGKGDALDAKNAQIKGNVFLNCYDSEANEEVKTFEANGKVNFVNATIDNALELKNVSNPKEMILDLSCAKIRKLVHEEKSWPKEGNLFLDGLTYDKIDVIGAKDSNSSKDLRLKWLELQNRDNFSLQPYEQLARVLREIGDEKAAKIVRIAKQEDLCRYGELNTLGQLRNRFLGFTIAHGYKPNRALFFALGFVAFGTLLFSNSSTLMSPSQVENFLQPNSSSSTKLSKDHPKFNGFVYSLDTFIPIMDLHQQSYWLPDANKGTEIEIPLILWKFKTGELLRYYFWIHIIFGWIFTSLWVAGFTGLVRRVE